MAAAPVRNVRDLGAVIDLVQHTAPERTDLIMGLSDLRQHACRRAADCRLCPASLRCERLLIGAFSGRW